MENENYQKELFEFEPAKKSAAKFGNIFQRTDFSVVLTPEKMVFTAIGIIMLMVIFFALGVEKGRAAVYTVTAATPRAVVKETTFSQITPERKTVAAATNITPKLSLAAAPKAVQAAIDKSNPYTVVAAAFSKEALALKEAGQLKAAGLEAFVYHTGPYYLACVGSFKDKVSAQNILNKVKRMRRDAYVRLK